MLKVNLLIESLSGGGAERVVSTLSQNVPDGVDLTVSLYAPKSQLYSIGGARLYSFDSVSQTTAMNRLLYLVSRRVLYRVYIYTKYLQASHYNVSVSFLQIPNILNIVVSHYLQIPTVISIRNNVFIKSSFFNEIIDSLLFYLVKRYSPYLIVNSEENKEHLINRCQLSPDKAICIYNPKDIDIIQSLQSELIEDSFFKTHDSILLNVGRLTLQKGQVHLLRIFSKLRQATPSRLVISGKGELESSLKSLAHDLGVEQYVLFTGWCENPYKYMNRADIFIFPSLFEGQPNAMIEALICGCPIVSSDCDYGPREILDGGKYGVLTKKLCGKIADPIHDPLTDAEQDMYDKTLYLIEHPDVRKEYAKLSKERIGIFAKDKIIKEYFSVFKEAAEGKKLR